MGVTDIPLTSEGVIQAKKLSKYLKNYHLDVIVTSPLIRAMATAEAIRIYHPKTPLIQIPLLKERSFGTLEGKSYEEVNKAHFQMVYAESWHYMDFVPPQGESLRDVWKRAKNAKDQLLSAYEGKTIAIVTHGTYARVFLGELLSIPTSELGTYEMFNASLTLVSYDNVHGPQMHLMGKLSED